MAERYEGVTGQPIDLYLYVRNPNGSYVDPYSTGQVLIYPFDPVNDWGHNVVASSPFGTIPTSTGMASFTCTTIDFLNIGVEVGHYLEIKIGPNTGKYKILRVYRHALDLETSFTAAESNVNFEITLLKAILYPQRVSPGAYKVVWTIPITESGGYYYDWWLNIKDTPVSATYDKVMSMYVSQVMPYYLADNSDQVTDRYNARVGATAFLEMEFRDYNTGAPRDPYSIQSINLYRFDPTAHTLIAVTSLTGTGDPADLYKLIDNSISFSSINPALHKYDAVEITSPVEAAGFYRLDYIDSLHAIKLIDILPGYYSSIEYTITYMYHLSTTNITRVNIGEYSISVPIPDDFVTGNWWDKWGYVPDSTRLIQHILYDFDIPDDYVLSDPALIEIDISGLLQLVDLGGATYSTLKPYVTKINHDVLVDPAYLHSITEAYDSITDATVEYSIVINGIDLWFNGLEWIPNTGYIQVGDQLWPSVVSVWHLATNWEDAKGVNDGVRHGTGTTFGSGGPYNSGNFALFNGTDDYVSVLAHDSLRMDTLDFSFAFAFKTNSIAEQVIAMQAYDTSALGGPGWVIDMLATGELRFRAGTGAQGSAFGLTFQTVATFNDNAWHTCFIGVANSSIIGMSCFVVDGIEIATGAGLNAMPLGTNYPIFVGADYNKGGTVQKFYAGSLQEFVILRNILISESDARLTNADWVNNKHSNYKTTVTSQFGLLPVVDNDEVGMNIYLVSDGTKQVQLDASSLDWYQNNIGSLSYAIGNVSVHEATYYDVPGPMDMCMVQGRLIKPDGTPAISETVVAYGFDTPQIANGAMIAPNSVETVTDVGGYFNLLLPQGITIWISIPLFGYRKKVTIPNATKVNWINLTALDEGGL